MGTLAENRKRMVELLLRLASEGGMRPAGLEGVKLLRVDRSHPRSPVLYEPSIVILANGRKRGYLGDRAFVYDSANYLVLTVPLPFECETEVGPDGPLLGVSIRVELAVLSELMMKAEARVRPAKPGPDECCVAATPLDLALSDATLRLIECLACSTDARVLGPQIVREITYRVMCGERGPALRALLALGGPNEQIHRALQRMHTAYAEPLDVATIADEAGMSVSAFHHHFKAVTATSPLQYLKDIRLHKARMLIAQDGMAASIAAAKVGYQSASQFSREFKRFFGASPIEEAERVRHTLGIRAGELAQMG